MKNLSNILRRSDISPLERVTVLVHNSIHKEKNGKDILTGSELHSITKGWYPSTSEARIYNKYLDIVRLEDTMKMDAQMFLYRSEVTILRNQRVLDTFLLNEKRFKKNIHQTVAQNISREESIKFLTRNTYLQYEQLLHLVTLHNLPKEIRDDLLLLDQEITSCEKYMEDQVFLYELLKNKKALSAEEKQSIVDRIYSRMYYEGVRKIKKSTAEKDGFILHGFFADLSTRDIFKKFSGSNKESDNEEVLLHIEELANNKGVTIKGFVQEKLLSWLDNGLFTEEYAPLFMSECFETWSGDTKKNHRELFMLWYEELQKTKRYFNKLFDSKTLSRKVIKREFLEMNQSVEIVTGASLYTCKENVRFIQEYKKQIDLLLPMASMFLFVENNTTPIVIYKTLCQLKKLAQKTSTIFDIDMAERYEEYIDSYQQEVKLLNFSLSKLTDLATECLYTEESFKYRLDFDENCFTFDLSDTEEVEVAHIATMYVEEFDKLEGWSKKL